MLDKKTKIISFPYQYGDNMPARKLGEGLTSKIILTGRPLLINKDVEEQTAELGVQQVGIPAASYLGVPIPVGDEIIGVLSVQSTEEENRFNENDLRLLMYHCCISRRCITKSADCLKKCKLQKWKRKQRAKQRKRPMRQKAPFFQR